jgi:hypothetical protein
MKRIVLTTAGIVIMTAALASAQTTTPPQTPAPATGQQTAVGPNFVDADGDGICDRFEARGANARGQGKAGARAGGRGYGPRDGTGNQGVGPRNGTGYGPGAKSGNCTGTGARGGRRGR